MVRFVNFRASDIQPNPDEVMYWVDLNTDPLGGSIKVWNAEGYWETIKVLQGTLPEFENRIKKWVEQQLKNFDEHLNEEIRQFDGRIAIISQDIETLKLTKQDKLIAGSGIDITDNVVSCVLDLTLYKIVSELPTEDIDTTKIYLVVDSEGTHGNLYKEYIYVDGEWELLGEYKADIDLSPYLTKVEAADTYATKLELQQEVNRATQAEVTEKNRALAAEEQLSKDIDAEKDRALIAERDNFNRIINEIARAEAAEKANAKAIEDEAKRAIEIETALASGMVEEQNRAIEAEEQLQGEIWAVDAKISEQGGSLTDAINSNTQAIADETARATQAEDNNRNLINAMDTAYKAADTATNTKLDNEITRAKAAEKTNADAIVVEADRNDAQDTLISNLQSSKVSTVNLVQDPDNELHYTLMVDSTNAGEISIPKDRFLKQAYYDPQKKSLIFIFVTEDGEQTVPVDISDLVDTYTAGNGLSLANNKFSITIDSTSDSYLTVGANGIKLSGVAAAINKLDTDYKAADTATLNSAKAYTDTKASDITDTVTQLQSDIEAEEIRATDVENRLAGQIFALNAAKQERLVSGETIKTVNGSSLLGAGNIVIEGGSGGGIDDAPSDSKEYVRKNAAWSALPTRSVTPVADSLVQRDGSGNLIINKGSINFNNNMEWWMQVNSDGNFILNSTGNANKFLYKDYEVGNLNNLYVLRETVIDAGTLDENTYYPVTIRMDSKYNNRIEVHTTLGVSRKPSWSTHEQGFSVHFVEEVYPLAWGINSTTHRRILSFNYNWTKDKAVYPIGRVTQMENGGSEVIYVRGGGRYYFYTTKNALPVLRTSDYTDSSQTVSPKAASDMTDADYATFKRTMVETADTSYEPTANSIVKRNADGYIKASYINTTTGRQNGYADTMSDVFFMSNEDGYIRRCSKDKFKEQMSGTGLDADTLDGQQDTAYLRYRSTTTTHDDNTLWDKIGIKEYSSANPDQLDAPFNYGAAISLPAGSRRFDIWYSDNSSTNSTQRGIFYRTGWNVTKNPWVRFLDANDMSATNTADKIPVRDANKQILTSGYKKEGSSDSYVLLGGGGHVLLAKGTTGNTMVQRDADGIVYGKYFYTEQEDEAAGTSISSVYIKSTDKIIRRVSFANFKSALNIPSAYTLPTASSTTLGGIKVGAGLSISNGVLSANGGGTADSVAWANVTGKPTWIGTTKPTYRLDEIASSTNQTVDASTTPVSRKKIVYVGKSGNGWISAVALGIRNVNGSFGPAVLSLGTKDTPSDTAAIDDGWVDYQFQTSGRIASKAGTFAVTSDIPTSLKNPNAIKFTGAVTGTYDGSSAVTLNIPTIAGPKGDTGAKGEKGDQGPQGLKGDTGDQGPRGYAGSDGANGKSLEFVWSGYTLGVRQEGTTSYTYSTSLRGATGAKGDKGDKGDTGPAGTTTWSGITGKPSWIGSSKPTYTWSEITSKPSWIGSSKPSYSYSEISGTPSLADVATSGLYNDLSNKPVIDTALSSTSTNAVQNKVIYEQLVKKAEIVRYQAGQNGYIKFDNGLLMQWGYKTASSTGTNTTYTPIAFYNATYCPIITYREPGQGMNIIIGLVTLVQNSYFTIRSRYTVGDSNGTGAGINDFYWVAVGRWK